MDTERFHVKDNWYVSSKNCNIWKKRKRYRRSNRRGVAVSLWPGRLLNLATGTATYSSAAKKTLKTIGCQTDMSMLMADTTKPSTSSGTPSDRRAISQPIPYSSNTIKEFNPRQLYPANQTKPTKHNNRNRKRRTQPSSYLQTTI